MARKLGVAFVAIVVVALALVLLAGRRSSSSERVTSEQRDVSEARATTSERGRARLGSHGRIEGEVVDTDGRAIAGAQVCAGLDARALKSEVGWRPNCVFADELGQFEIDVLPGRHRITASARGYVLPPVVRGWAGLMTTVAAGQVQGGVILRLRRGGGEVRGVVRDIMGGTVEGARVFSEATLALTDDDGRFSLWLDARSFVEIQVRADGYAHTSVTEWRPIGRELEILLRPEVVLSGRVITADTGEPVAGVDVLANVAPRLLGAMTDSEPRVQTGPDGRFRFPGLTPGRYKPEVRSGNFRGAANESVLLTLGADAAEVVIRVHPARQLGGRVIEVPSGEACELGTVTIHDAAGSIVERALTDPDGRIAVGGLLPAPYSLEIDCDDTTPSSFATVDLGERDAVDEQWEVERPNGRAIRGRVLDASGRGVALARVAGELREPEDPGMQASAIAVTEADGTFEILDLPPGGYVFGRVEAEGFAEPSGSTKVTLARDRDTNDVEIVLPDAGALRIRVRDPSGAPVPGAEIKLGKGKGGTIWKSMPNSEWLIDPCTPGMYHVVVLRPGIRGRAGPDDPSFGEQGVPVEVVVGETAELVLTAPARNEVITGTVRTDEGEPVADAAVWAVSSETYLDWGGREQRPEVARTVTDIDGRYTLANLESGTHAVHARSQAGVEHVRDGIASGSTNVDFELVRAGSVAGRVEVGAGEPPPSLFAISVNPVDGRRGRSEEFLFTEGEWRIVSVPPGEVTIEVAAAEGTASANVTVVEGEERGGVVLELGARGLVRGRVVDAETGEPVPGYLATASSGRARASALDPDGKRYTDADGYFELRQVPSGSVKLRLWSARGLSGGYRDVDLNVEVESGGTTDLGTIHATRKPKAAGQGP